jgi:hypothetical protein
MQQQTPSSTIPSSSYQISFIPSSSFSSSHLLSCVDEWLTEASHQVERLAVEIELYEVRCKQTEEECSRIEEEISKLRASEASSSSPFLLVPSSVSSASELSLAFELVNEINRRKERRNKRMKSFDNSLSCQQFCDRLVSYEESLKDAGSKQRRKKEKENRGTKDEEKIQNEILSEEFAQISWFDFVMEAKAEDLSDWHSSMEFAAELIKVTIPIFKRRLKYESCRLCSE